MTGKIHDDGHRELFRPRLEDFIGSRHGLVLLAGSDRPVVFRTGVCILLL
jgi:hypothetical protein